MLRFTIRDLLWLMVVVAMACAWFANRWRMDFTHERDTMHLLSQERILDSVEATLTSPTVDLDQLRIFLKNERREVGRLAEVPDGAPVMVQGVPLDLPQQLEPILIK